MTFTKLVLSVFYTNLSDGLELFVDCLQFSIEHKDLNTSQPYCVLKKDGISIMLFQDEQLAKEHNPELRLVTNNIEEVFNNFINKKQIAVAVSGGIDSLALTIALNNYCLNN